MISILIPTMNRSQHLARALHHYARTGFDGWVIIGDSSDEKHAANTQALVESLKNNLNLIYRYYPKPQYAHDGMCMQKMIELAPTPYAVYSGDDDLMETANLKICAEFLENNPEYSAAHGYRANVALDGEGPWTLPLAAGFVPGQVLENDSAAERFVGYMRTGISMQYFVHRTESWQHMYEHVDQAPSRYLGAELLPCAMSAILGKVKGLEILTTVFQRNNQKILDWTKTSMFDLVNQSQWPPSMEVTQKALSRALAKADGMDQGQASEIVHREIWLFVGSAMQSHFAERFGQEQASKREEQAKLVQILNPRMNNYPQFRRAYLSMVSHPPTGVETSGMVH